MSISFGSRRTTVERKYFARRKSYRPLRFVGIGVIAMIVIIYLMYKLMVR